MKNIRNLVAAALCFGLSFSVLGPAVANPFDGVCDLSGDGSSGDPHLLKSEADLIGMQDCTVSGTTHYALGGDIFISAGVGDFFEDAYFDDDVDVSLDGRGFGIYGLRFGDPLGRNVGLFGKVDDLTVRNITLQAGAIVGGDESGVVVGEAINLIAEDVTILSDSFTCRDECGLLAGRVRGNLTVDRMTVVANAFSVGDRSGLLVGYLDHETTAVSTISNVNASGTFRFNDDSGSFGGLIGKVNGGGSLSITNAYVMAQGRVASGPAELSGPDELGGLIGAFHTDSNVSADSSLSIRGVFTDFDFEGARFFGGLVGSIYQTDPQTTDPVLTIDIDDVMVRGVVEYRAGLAANAGGLIGDLDVLGFTDLNIEDALVKVVHLDQGLDSSLINLVSIVEVDAADLSSNALRTVVFDNVVLDNTLWLQNTMNTAELNVHAGIENLTSSELDDPLKVPFNNLAAHPGVLGTHDWEMCATAGGPFPTFTPNACGQADLTMSGNQVSAALNVVVSSITDQAPKGFGASLFYSLEPSLPRGLYLNPVTGTITGTPIELRAAGTYKIQKYNAFSNPFRMGSLAAGDRVQTTASSFFVAEALMPTLVTQGSAAAPSVPQNIAVAYTGPILMQFSKASVIEGRESFVSVSGSRLNLVTKITVDGKDVQFVATSANLLELSLPALSLGFKTLVVSSTQGSLQVRDAFLVVPDPAAASEVVTTNQKVNAGSFKGFVAVYARGYEGKRMSAKIGKDWVIVPSLASNFVRVTDFTGAGVNVSVRIYIDRVLLATIPLVTK